MTNVSFIDANKIWNKNPYTGQLQIYCYGQWGTVCNDLFVATHAIIVCRELQYLTILIIIIHQPSNFHFIMAV